MPQPPDGRRTLRCRFESRLPPSSPLSCSRYLSKKTRSVSWYLSKPRCCMAKSTSEPLIVFRLSPRRRDAAGLPRHASPADGRRDDGRSPAHLSDASEVTKEMNSETHSCTISLASFEIFALSGRLPFMMRAARGAATVAPTPPPNPPAATQTRARRTDVRNRQQPVLLLEIGQHRRLSDRILYRRRCRRVHARKRERRRRPRRGG